MLKELNMKVYKDIPDVKLPTKANNSDAGFDLYSPIDFEFTKNGPDYIIIDTHIHFDIPKGYVGFIKSKSGLNVKKHIIAEGVIDSGYTGSIVVKLTRNSDCRNENIIFKKGDKITQIVFLPIPEITLEEVNDINKFDTYGSTRGNKGFGSSGR